MYIVMPCYNEEAGISTTVEAVAAKLLELKSAGRIAAGSTMFFVNDGSRDATWDLLEKAHTEKPDVVKGISFAGNRGKEYALMAGVIEAGKPADAVVCMDADLQFDIEAINEFLVATPRVMI